MRSEEFCLQPIIDERGVTVGHRVFVSRGYLNGKRHRRSKVVRGTKARAKIVARELWESMGNPRPAVGQTLREFVEGKWLPWELKNPKVRDETYRDYESKMRLYVLPTLGNLPIANLGAMHVDELTVSLYTRLTVRQPEKGVRYLSPTTVRQVWRVFRIAMKMAVRWGVVERSPFDGLDAPSVESAVPDSLSADEARAYFAAFRGHRIEPIVLLSLGCGMRRSESCGMTWEGLDLERGTYRVTQVLQQYGRRVYLEPPKTIQSRATTPMSAFVTDRLGKLAGEGPLVADGPERTEHMAPDKVVDLYDGVLKSAGLRRVTMKNLRHSFANILKAQGVSVFVISTLMRHATVTTTQRFYFDDDMSPMLVGVDALDRLFGGVPEVCQREGS